MDEMDNQQQHQQHYPLLPPPQGQWQRQAGQQSQQPMQQITQQQIINGNNINTTSGQQRGIYLSQNQQTATTTMVMGGGGQLGYQQNNNTYQPAYFHQPIGMATMMQRQQQQQQQPYYYHLQQQQNNSNGILSQNNNNHSPPPPPPPPMMMMTMARVGEGGGGHQWAQQSHAYQQYLQPNGMVPSYQPHDHQLQQSRYLFRPISGMATSSQDNNNTNQQGTIATMMKDNEFGQQQQQQQQQQNQVAATMTTMGGRYFVAQQPNGMASMVMQRVGLTSGDWQSNQDNNEQRNVTEKIIQEGQMQARPHQRQQQAVNGTAMQRVESQPEYVQSNNVLDIENPSQQQQHQVRFEELLEDIPEEKAKRIRITADKVLVAVEAHTVAIIQGGKFRDVPGEFFDRIMKSQKQTMSSFDCYSTSAITTLKDAPDGEFTNQNDYYSDSNKRRRRNVLVLRDNDSNSNDEDKQEDDGFFKIDEDDYLVMCDVLNDLWPAFSSYESAKYETILQAIKAFVEVNKVDGLFRVTKLKIPQWVDYIILPKQIRGLDCLEVFHAHIYGNTFPLWIFGLQNLTKLNLTGPDRWNSNALPCPKFLPVEIGNLTSLRKLILNSFHDLSGLPESIGNLISLERLCINGTAISTLPLSVQNLKKLKGLDLSSNEKLRHVPDYIQYLSGLEVIYLSSTKIVSLPGTIGKLVNLSNIVLNYTEGLEHLPDELQQLTNLKGISLRSSGISSLPNIEGLQSLEKLDLHFTQKLQTLPDGIFVGLNIRKMDLSASSISSLPKSIGRLRSLEELDISQTINLESIEIIGWEKLRELKAGNSSLRSIRIVNVETLEAIDLNHSSKLENLELRNLRNLKKLEVRESYCGRAAVLRLTGLSSLEYLHIAKSNIRHIPDDLFEGCPNLRELFIFCIQITSIPDSLTKLEKLENLHLSSCRNLTDISRDIERILLGCSSLKHLSIQSNNIVKINPIDAAYRNLEALNLDGNPIMSDGNKSGNEMLLNLIKNCPYLRCIGDLTEDQNHVDRPKPEFVQHVYLLTKNRIRKRLSSLEPQSGALWPYILSRKVTGFGCGKAAFLPSCDHSSDGCDCGADCCATASLSHADCTFRLLVDHGGHNIISQHNTITSKGTEVE